MLLFQKKTTKTCGCTVTRIHDSRLQSHRYWHSALRVSFKHYIPNPAAEPEQVGFSVGRQLGSGFSFEVIGFLTEDFGSNFPVSSGI